MFLLRKSVLHLARSDDFWHGSILVGCLVVVEMDCSKTSIVSPIGRVSMHLLERQGLGKLVGERRDSIYLKGAIYRPDRVRHQFLLTRRAC